MVSNPFCLCDVSQHLYVPFHKSGMEWSIDFFSKELDMLQKVQRNYVKLGQVLIKTPPMWAFSKSKKRQNQIFTKKSYFLIMCS